MTVATIRSVANPRVKAWAQLLQKKGRDRQKKFILEGIHLVKEALEAECEMDCIVYSEERGWPHELTRPSGIELVCASENVLHKCTDAKTPQSVFAIMPTNAIVGQDEPQLFRKEGGLYIACDRIRDPGNLGTIIRSADAAGADGVLISPDSVDLFHPKTVRATMGSLFHLPLRVDELAPFFANASDGAQRIGASQNAATPMYELDWKKTSWIVIGNEGDGLSPALAPYITTETAIPMYGKAESLNAGMAATLLLYEALRQRRHT